MFSSEIVFFPESSYFTTSSLSVLTSPDTPLTAESTYFLLVASRSKTGSPKFVILASPISMPSAFAEIAPAVILFAVKLLAVTFPKFGLDTTLKVYPPLPSGLISILLPSEIVTDPPFSIIDGLSLLTLRFQAPFLCASVRTSSS